MMKPTLFRLVSIVCFMLLLIPSDSESIQEPKIALVIGNGAYKSSPLANPVNDAKDMTAVLEKLGFSVILKINDNQKSMENSIRVFGKKLRSGGVGLFYFAGHGLQVDGRNYLVPIGADIESEADVKYESVDAGRVLSQMHEAQNGLNIIILDACRDNPYARSFRTSEKGLAKMDAPTGSILAYSTAPGSVAADGTGRNGLYTSMLLKHMVTPDFKIEDVFKNVRNDVIIASSDKQVPWESSSLRGDFYFNSKRGVAAYPEVPFKGRLSVDTYPRNARIIISNIALKFYQGIELDAGSYHVEVSADGYESQKIWINLGSGQDESIYVRLGPSKGRLYVDTEPEGARVRVLDIKPKYIRGMELDPRRYHVEVAAKGYETERRWIDLGAGHEAPFSFDLAKIRYTITASSGSNGSISPTGKVVVAQGGHKSFEITPNPGYRIADVKVDGGRVGAKSKYAFNDVTSDRRIEASFKQRPPYERFAFNPEKERIEIPYEKKLNPNNQITLEAWFKANALSAVHWIICKLPNPPNAQPYYQYALGLRGGGIYFPLGINRARQWIDGAFKGDLKINEWQHVAATYDGNRMRLYLDGKKWYYDREIEGPISEYNTNLAIGDLAIAGKKPGLYKGSRRLYEGFKGQLAEVRIWNVARTADQILANMHKTIPAGEHGLVFSSTNRLRR